MKSKKRKEQLSKLTIIFFLVAMITFIISGINDQKPSYSVKEISSNSIPIKLNDSLGEIVKNQINTLVSEQDSTQVKEELPVESTQPQQTGTPEVKARQDKIDAVVTVSKTNPFYKEKLFVEDNYNIKNQLNNLPQNLKGDLEKLKVIAENPISKWVVGGTNEEVFNTVNDYVSKSSLAGSLPVLIAYNIPVRDCNSYSSGGATSAQNYTSWITSFANAIGTKKAVVVLEPDAISAMDCLSQDKQNERISLLSSAVEILKRNSNTYVYIDAGHSKWIGAIEMALRLNKVNIKLADGFALNVSNFQLISDLSKYGEEISMHVGNKHFILDTSRNGRGPTQDQQWCNPRGRALGHLPTFNTNHPLIDAFLWLKVPGESDGSCNGGPSAGVWWPEYALELINNYNGSVLGASEAKDIPSGMEVTQAVPMEWEVLTKSNEQVQQVGNKVLFTTSIKSNLDEDVVDTIVDIEIYNKNNERVLQRYFEGENFKQGIVKEYTLLWTPTKEDRYHVKVGVFTKKWAKNLAWSEDSHSFNVTKAARADLNNRSVNQHDVQIWWPTNQSRISGVQPFKAVVRKLNLKEYNLYWQVEGGRLNLMQDNYTDSPHKEILVDLQNWQWKSSKTYRVKFIAKDLTGNIFAEKEIELIAN